MASNKKNYYAVVRGRTPGLYKSWPEAEAEVRNFNDAKFKGFYSLGDALDYLAEHGITVPEHHSYVAEEPPEDCVLIYTDGGAIGNPGPGGYGVVLRYGNHRKELSQGFKETTNNRMELMACIAGLTALKKPSKVIIYSDSKYVVDSINKGWARRWRLNGWKKKDNKIVENRDLWQKLLDALDIHEVEFIWVKGHAGKKENERCDELAQRAARDHDQKRDEGYAKNDIAGLFS